MTVGAERGHRRHRPRRSRARDARPGRRRAGARLRAADPTRAVPGRIAPQDEAVSIAVGALAVKIHVSREAPPGSRVRSLHHDIVPSTAPGRNASCSDRSSVAMTQRLGRARGARSGSIRWGIGLRLDPSTSTCTSWAPRPNFNESMYFNVYDPDNRLGGFFRLGNRANEGTGEMTACLYLPDGRVAFMFRRPKVTDNSAFDAAGMRFEVVEPFIELRVSYEGRVGHPRQPSRDGRSPRRLHRESPHVRVCRPVDLPRTVGHVRRRAGSAGRASRRGIRPGPLRAAGGADGHGPGGRGNRGSSTASGCATTVGGRATGRHRGTTGG